MNGTEHHCDTCTCAPPVPDLNAALQAAATLDVRGAYVFHPAEVARFKSARERRSA